MPVPKIVIVGRPNVGKSSLFNWLASRRISIVEQVAGVTRDRVSTFIPLDEGEAPGTRMVELIDTGGIGIVDRDDLSDEVERQIQVAIDEADLILFVVDIRDGRMPLDEEVAQRLRYLDKPIVLVANKADVASLDERGADFVRLGRGSPLFISTREDRNKGALLEAIAERLPEGSSEAIKDAVMKIAVVGRPNTGKSTFINTLAQSERVIVSEIPGTTRDSIDVRFEMDGLPFLAIDTAGVRRHAKLRDSLDFFSLHRAQRSIRRADVALLFLDPTQGVTKLDKQLASYIEEEHKPCVFTVNKWDLVLGDPDSENSKNEMRRFAVGIQHAFRSMSYMPLAFITAKTGKNVKVVVNLAQSLFKQANLRVGTGKLNRLLRQAVEANSPPVRENKVPKIYYAAQVAVAPPTIVVMVNNPNLFDPSYHRYLINTFREHLPFRDIPMRLILHARSRSRTPGNAPSEPTEVPGEDLTPEEERRQERWLRDVEVNEMLDELKM